MKLDNEWTWKRIAILIIVVAIVLFVACKVVEKAQDKADRKLIYDNCISKGGANLTRVKYCNNSNLCFTCAFPNGTVRNVTIEGIEGLV